MGTDLAAVDAIFKRVYNEGSDVLIKQQNLNAPMWGKWKKSSLKPTPQGIYNPIVMQGNERGGAINENEGFKNPDSILPVQPSITPKLVIWNFEVTGSVIRLSETNKSAFIQGLDAQQQDNLGRLYSDLDRQSWGVGTGQIALTTTAATSTALIVDNALPFRAGMYIDAWTALGGTKEISGIKITAVNPATNTLTLASTQTWSSGDIICKENVCDGVTSSLNAKELMGWRGICDTTTYSTTFEGVSVSTYAQWQGNVVDASVSPVSQDLLQKTRNRGAIIGGKEADTLVSNYGQARNFINTEINKTRYEGGDIKGGNITLKWGTLDWVVMWTYPIGEVGMMVQDNIQKFQTNDVKLSDLPGQSLYQLVGRDAIGGYYVYQGNLGVWKRNDQNRLINLTEPAF